MSNQLTTIEKLNPIEVYGSNNIDAVLKTIEEEVRVVKLDISTDIGRKEVASLAYKVARSKTFLDDLGKKIGEEAQAKLNAINAERKKARDHLDALKDEIRMPLTLWENAEKTRVELHQKMIAEITYNGDFVASNFEQMTVEQIEKKVSDIVVINRDWQEFTSRAGVEISNALAKMELSLVKLKAKLTEKAELERLRAAEAERAQKERDERIAKDAAERATREAELKAQAAKKMADEALARAKYAKELAELKAKEAAKAAAKKASEEAEAAKVRQQLAVEAERKKIVAEKQAEADAAAKREANTKHKMKINNEILVALREIGLPENVAKDVIAAIVKGHIPHTKIGY